MHFILSSCKLDKFSIALLQKNIAVFPKQSLKRTEMYFFVISAKIILNKNQKLSAPCAPAECKNRKNNAKYKVF